MTDVYGYKVVEKYYGNYRPCWISHDRGFWGNHKDEFRYKIGKTWKRDWDKFGPVSYFDQYADAVGFKTKIGGANIRFRILKVEILDASKEENLWFMSQDVVVSGRGLCLNKIPGVSLFSFPLGTKFADSIKFLCEV